MTREDYILLAEAYAKGARGDFLGILCAALKNDNPRFDEARFLAHIEKVSNDIGGSHETLS